MLTIFLSALETEDERLSFEEIYNDNKNILYNCAYSILRDEPSAEDAVQDAFVSLARNFEKTKQMERNQIRGYMIISSTTKESVRSLLRISMPMKPIPQI